MSFVDICEKIDRVIMAPHCINIFQFHKTYTVYLSQRFYVSSFVQIGASCPGDHYWDYYPDALSQGNSFEDGAPVD